MTETIIIVLGGISFMVNYHWEDPVDDGAWSTNDVGCIGRGWLPPATYAVIEEVFKDDDGEEWTHYLSKQALSEIKDKIHRIADSQD